MAKTKKANNLGDQKLSMFLVALIAVLVGVIIGTAIDKWQEAAYDIGESEAIESSAVRGTQSQVKKSVNENTNQQSANQNWNANQNSAKLPVPIRE